MDIKLLKNTPFIPAWIPWAQMGASLPKIVGMAWRKRGGQMSWRVLGHPYLLEWFRSGFRVVSDPWVYPHILFTSRKFRKNWSSTSVGNNLQKTLYTYHIIHSHLPTYIHTYTSLYMYTHIYIYVLTYLLQGISCRMCEEGSGDPRCKGHTL